MRSCLLLPSRAALGWRKTRFPLQPNSVVWTQTAAAVTERQWPRPGKSGCIERSGWVLRRSPADLPYHLLRAGGDRTKGCEMWCLKDWLLAFLPKCFSSPSPQRLNKDRKKRGKSLAEISDCEETRHSLFWGFQKAAIRSAFPAIVPSHKAGYPCCEVHLTQRWAVL